MHDEMLTYGLKRGTKDDLRHIDSVPKGLVCDCVCPHCQHNLIARNGGTKKTHHFAHASGAECGKARMTALHMLAQNILASEKELMLPDYQGDYFQTETGNIIFDEVKLEETYTIEDKQFRPDCVGIKYDTNNNPHYLWIEIFVTHEVGEVKEAYIKDSENACIEIDLSDMLYTDYTEDSISKRLSVNKNDRKWISCPKYDKIESQRKEHAEQEEAERQRIEKEYREHQQEIRRELQKEVVLWFETKQSDLANVFIQRIKSNPFSDEVKMADVLIPGFDFIAYIDNAPKNEDGKRVFYTLLNYYYNKVPNANYSDIKRKINTFLYIQDELSAEEKVKLEELISLRILYILERNRKRFYDVDIDDVYKTCIKKYITDPDIRNAVMMVASVFYHHVVGSNARNFGELTQEIIQHQPSLAKLYLIVIDSQDKYPNDYTLDGHNMLAELNQFVETHTIEANEHVNNILKDCYEFAFKPKVEPLESPAHYEPYGYEKVFARQNINDAWAKLNNAFKEQSY